MANVKRLATLQNIDKTEDIYPITAAAAVYANDGETLEKKISKSISIETVWENASPSSNFSEKQFVIPPGTEYIIIFFDHATTMLSRFGPDYSHYVAALTENSAKIVRRHSYISSDQNHFVIQDAYMTETYGSYASRVKANSDLRPLKIIAIKGGH